jgi:hypothetical protein
VLSGAGSPSYESKPALTWSSLRPADSTPVPLPAGWTAHPVLMAGQGPPRRTGRKAHREIGQWDPRPHLAIGALNDDRPRAAARRREQRRAPLGTLSWRGSVGRWLRGGTEQRPLPIPVDSILRHRKRSSITAASSRYATAAGELAACSRTDLPPPGASATRTDFGIGGPSTSRL